jgi:hypothetical protein
MKAAGQEIVCSDKEGWQSRRFRGGQTHGVGLEELGLGVRGAHRRVGSEKAQE